METYEAHPTAVIDEGCQIGEGTKVHISGTSRTSCLVVVSGSIVISDRMW